MHRIGDPSAPANLRGKQWTAYNPAGTSSSFRASTRMTSWKIGVVSSCHVDSGSYSINKLSMFNLYLYKEI